MIRHYLLRLLPVVVMVVISACSGAGSLFASLPDPTITFTLQREINARGCNFNSDSTLVFASNYGVFSVETGKKLIGGGWLDLSENKQYVASDGSGVYEIASGDMLFKLPANTGSFIFSPIFSPDSTAVIAYDGVYAVPSGEHLVTWNKEIVEAGFSPNSQFVVLLGDGVYNVQTGERLFTTAADYDAYSPHYSFTKDGSRLAINRDGLYDMTTGEKLVNGFDDFAFSADESMISTSYGGLYETTTGEFVVDAPSGMYVPQLNPDNTLVAISNGDAMSKPHELIGAVYEVATGERRFTYNGIYAKFSASGNYLVVWTDGVYEVATGEKLYELGEEEQLTLQPNADRYLVGGQGVYDIASRELLYGIYGDLAYFSPDGTLLYLTDGIHDAVNGGMILNNATNGVFNADRSLFTTQTDKGCGIYRVESKAGST